MVRSRASRAHPSLHGASGCARRSSRSRRRTSCASCCAGSISRPASGAKVPMRSTPSSRSCRASRRPPPPGNPRSCLRVWTTTTSPGSTTCACPAAPSGRGCHHPPAAPRRRALVRSAPIALLPRRAAGDLEPARATRAGGPGAAPARTARGRRPARARRIVLRRDRRRHRPAAHAGRGDARGDGRRGRGHLRQLRGPARAAHAIGKAQVVRWTAGTRRALFGIEEAGRWSLRKARSASRRPHRVA